ncbi:transcriptional regulator [Phenylobacterium sp.]|uniref:transcriptional regulator n=1 Tax=Phenylobacterium sp. TaxID=1871053 RepID=UPI00272EFDF6|nr:transcriptional regulator [Phenylobacterium sp.]MDP2215508.1 transcriptional regulator [Phenylobacterium sp.]
MKLDPVRGLPGRDLVPAWTPDQRAQFRHAPMTFAHGLAGTGLFEDAALASLLDRYPAELYDINLFDFDDEGQFRLRTGVRGRLPGDRVLEGIKEGRVWVQLRRVEAHYEALGPIIAAAFEEIRAQVPDFRPVQLNGQLILSAPQAKVPFHADSPGVCLFHMRGRKRIWIYPADEAHMPQTGMEDILLKQQTEELPYRRDMDAAAQVFDLEPGMAVTWPLHAPHRIENQAGFNVSLSVDYQTWGSRITNGAHYANGIFRRKGLPVAAMARTPMPIRAGLWAASLALKRARLVEDKIANLDRSFELDGVKT